MKRITKIITAIALALLPASVLAQTNRPSVVVSSEEVLNRPVRQWLVDQEDTLLNLMMHSLMTSRTPGGIVSIPKSKAETRLKLKSPSLKLRDVLDAIVAVEPRYRWEVEQDVINFLPSEEYPPMLNAVIPEFKVENVNKFGVIDALEAIPEFQYQATALGYSNFTDPRVRCCGGLGGTQTFSLHLLNATVREILNAIVRAHGYAIWNYSEEVHEGKKYFTVYIPFG